jgi:predicted ATP-dependent endonuclease of OLD family
MYISKLCLRNYRNFRNSCIRFKKGVNTIIGENGCGKTNIMQAMRILLDESLPRTYRFYESDFNRSIGKWKGHWIIIQIFFDELDYGDECQILALHLIGAAEDLDRLKGSCTVVFRPKLDVRTKLYEYSLLNNKTTEGLNLLLDSITLDDYELCYLARTSLEFSDDHHYGEYVGDFENVTFPNPADVRFDIFGNKVYIGNFLKEISCTYIKALRDVESDLKSYRDNPLVNLLRGKERSIEVNKKTEITTKISDLNTEISSLEEVKEIASGITNNIHSSVGKTYAPAVSIRSELPADMERLMQSLKIWVGDSSDEGYLGRIWELSLGGCNLIYLSTKLLEYEKVKSRDKVANFLLIEEPEAHIHTHIQKTLFDKIPENKTQVIFTTHSTHISSVSKISAVNIISKFSNRVEVFEPSNNLSKKGISRVERYLDAVRSDLLFAKSVMLVEGDAEQILIPIMFKRIFGTSLDEIGISLINIGSTGFQNVAQLFHSDRIRKRCAIVTDLDQSIIQLPASKDDDTNAQRNFRNAEEVGERRKNKLNEFVKDNPFLKVFYAKNTFEIQFLQANNVVEVCDLVNDNFATKQWAKKVEEKLSSDSEEIAGREILRLANKFKKGWFALLLSDKIALHTHFPDYISKALGFCMGQLSLSTLKSIAVKRFTDLSLRPFADDLLDYKELAFTVSQIESKEQLFDFLIKEAPDDDLTNCIKELHAAHISAA